MTDPSIARRVRAQGLAVLAVVFVAGALAGAAAEHLRGPGRRANAIESESAPTEQVVENMKMAATRIPVLYEALQLTPAQREQIRAIMDASRPKTDFLLRETWPQLRALLDSLQRQVEQVLTPEQRARLTEMRRGVAAPVK
jgi:Spy/CpxP family protein refolding chaperone